MITLKLNKIEHDYDRESGKLQIRFDQIELAESERNALEILMDSVSEKRNKYILHDLILESLQEIKEIEFLSKLIDR